MNSCVYDNRFFVFLKFLLRITNWNIFLKWVQWWIKKEKVYENLLKIEVFQENFAAAAKD